MSIKLPKALIKKFSSKYYDDHKKPVTRRDFIKMGLLAGGGLLMPSFFPTNALANNAVHIPFLVFDLAGGAGLPANFLAGQKGGPEDLCAKYEQHGWDPRAAGALDRTFGLPMAANVSAMLRGLKETLPAELSNPNTNKSFKMSSICNFSLDDTSTNNSSALSLVSRAGLVGEVLKSGVGQLGTLSGGNSNVFLQDSRYRPKLISDQESVLNMTSFGDRFTDLDGGTKHAIFARLEELGASHGDVADAYRDLKLFGELHVDGDPMANREIADLYGLSDFGAGALYTQAAIAYNVLNGFTGPGAITIGNCDYHDGTQTTGDQKDLEIGQAIGRAVHMAYLLGKPLFFQVVTDGGVYASSDSFNRAWIGDQNLHTLTIMGYFNPNKDVVQNSLQLGHYTKNGEVQINTLVGDKPESMARAVIANYLSIHGMEGQFENLTDIRIQPNELDQLIAFGK